MERLAKIRERISAISVEQEAICALADKESRSLNEEEAKRFDALDEEKKRCKADEARFESLASDTASRGRRATGLSSPPETVNSNASIVIHEPNFTKDPNKGFKSPREFCLAVMRHGSGYAKEARDERLRHLATAGSDEQGGYSDPYGGFLVPVGMSPDVLRLDPEPDPFEGRTTRIPMSNPTVKLNARVDKNHSSSVSGGLTVSRRMETTAATSSRQEYEQVVLQATSLFGLAYATEEILTDSPVSFAAVLAQGFQDEFTSRLIDERINGTGAGEFKGILSDSNAYISVAKETGQAAATVVYDNIIKMRARSWGYRNAVWLANHNVMPQLAKLNQSVGTGGALVWAPSAVPDVPDTLLGRPIIFTEYCKTLGTLGDLILFNGTQYLEGIYQPLQSAESVHVRFLNHERTFKFWLRNAGALWWKSTLTPKNGDTLSPVVVLATRS